MSILNTLDGERGIPPINSERVPPWRKGAVLLVVFLAVAVLIMYWTVEYKPERIAQNEEIKEIQASTIPPRTFELPEPEVVIAAPEPEPEPEPVEPKVVVQEKIVYVKAPQPKIDKGLSRSLAVAPGSLSGAATAPTQPAPATGLQTAPVQVAQANTTTNQSGFSGSINNRSQANAGIEVVKAVKLNNRDSLITRGTMIPCVLGTNLNSQLSGLTKCRITQDVYSDDLSQVLAHAGSIVTGEYQSTVAQGMNRIGVIWDRVKTTSGNIVNLDSPATDQLGGTGIQGNVNNHFWKRFGGAILLSLVDDVASAVTSSNRDAAVVVNSATSAGSDLAAEVLRNTINIPPTIEVRQGEIINIFVRRDLDFSDVL